MRKKCTAFLICAVALAATLLTTAAFAAPKDNGDTVLCVYITQTSDKTTNVTDAAYDQYFAQGSAAEGLTALLNAGKVYVNGYQVPATIEERTTGDAGTFTVMGYNKLYSNGDGTWGAENYKGEDKTWEGARYGMVTALSGTTGFPVTLYDEDGDGDCDRIEIFFYAVVMVEAMQDNGDGTISVDRGNFTLTKTNIDINTITFPSENVDASIQEGDFAMFWEYADQGWFLLREASAVGYLTDGSDHAAYTFNGVDTPDGQNNPKATINPANRPGQYTNAHLAFGLTDLEITFWTTTEGNVPSGFTSGDSAREGLTRALAQCESYLDGVVTSADGSDVDKGVKWVTASAMAEYQTALDTARAVLADSGATNGELDAQTYALFLATYGSSTSVKAGEEIEAMGGFLAAVKTGQEISLYAGSGVGEIVLDASYYPEAEYSGEINVIHTEQYGDIVDNPYARVLLVGNGVSRAAIVSLETAQSPDDIIAYVKEIVGEICGVPASNIWVHTTHQFGFMHRPSDETKATMYDEALKAAVTDAAKGASATYQQAVLGVETTECYVTANKNINNPEDVDGGPYHNTRISNDTLGSNYTLTMLTFKSATTEDYIAFYMSYGTKPSVLCTTGKADTSKGVNSELTGVACKLLEAEYGVPCVFCMPAAGDQYPVETAQYYDFDENGTWGLIDIGYPAGIEIVERLGAEIADVADQAIAKTSCEIAALDTIQLAAATFQYPNKAEDGYVEVNVDVMILGDVAFVGFKQEMDSETERQIIEASPYGTTLLISFMNGDGKYMPHIEAYSFNNGVGTWETNRSAFAPGAAEEFVLTATNLLDAVYTGDYVTESTTASRGSYAGGSVQIGGYNWTILDKDGDKALLLCDSIVSTGAYYAAGGDATWESSDIRAWLNGSFLSSLSGTERDAILNTAVSNPGNSRYGVAGGADTSDYVFLLSIGEAEAYIKGTDIAVARDGSGAALMWYLRSPGEAVDAAACVSVTGAIDYHGDSNGVSYVAGIRPAMWVDLAALNAASFGQTQSQPASGESASDSTTYYTVVAGDCLWNIAAKYYHSGALFDRIAETNDITAPWTIYVGQTLIIP